MCLLVQPLRHETVWASANETKRMQTFCLSKLLEHLNMDMQTRQLIVMVKASFLCMQILSALVLGMGSQHMNLPKIYLKEFIEITLGFRSWQFKTTGDIDFFLPHVKFRI